MKTRGIRRFLRKRGWVTIALTVAAAALLALAGWVILRAASMDDEGTSTGVIPAQLPEGFPIPPGAVIGEGTFDAERSLTTLSVTTPGSIVDAVSAHTIGLVSNGFVVGQSEAQGDGWVIRFSRLDMRGTIEVSEGTDGIVSLITVSDP